MCPAVRHLLAWLPIFWCGCRTPVTTPADSAVLIPDATIEVFAALPGDDPVQALESRVGAVELATAVERVSPGTRARVSPSADSPAELVITGRWLPSPPGAHRLHLHAEDAAGRTWVNTDYENTNTVALADRAAADLLAAARRLTPADARELSQLAELRAAARFASPSFAEHLDRDANGRLSVLRLPAENDPQWLGAQRIRARERALADAIDTRYRALAVEAGPPLATYRTLAAAEARRQLSLNRRGVWQPFRLLAGGLLEGLGIFTEALGDLHDDPNGPLDQATAGLNRRGDALDSGLERELAASRTALLNAGHLLSAEMAPSVVELDGKVTALTGDAETQFARFRQILRARLEQETGGAAPAP